MKLDERLKKRSCIVLKDVIAKNFVAKERTSQFYICVYIQCTRRRPIPTETDVLVPVFPSQ